MKTFLISLFILFFNPLALSIETDMLEAIRYGDTERVQELIDEGLDVNERSESEGNITPLHWAAYFGYKNIAELLLNEGSRINIQDVNGRTPLHLAALFGHKETTELLLKRDAKPDARDSWNETPLHYAATKGHKETVELLLDYKADPKKTGFFGKTALEQARHNRHQAVVELFQSRGITQ